MPRRSAPRVKPPSLATAWKARSCAKFITLAYANIRAMNLIYRAAPRTMPARSQHRDRHPMDPQAPYLLTPGPLSTSASVKRAMLRDWGSRDRDFIALNARVRARLLELAGGAGSHVCVPLQGSGTFVVEALLGTLLPKRGKLLAL